LSIYNDALNGASRNTRSRTLDGDTKGTHLAGLIARTFPSGVASGSGRATGRMRVLCSRSDHIWSLRGSSLTLGRPPMAIWSPNQNMAGTQSDCMPQISWPTARRCQLDANAISRLAR